MYGYAPFGQQVKSEGASDTDFGFAGMHSHSPSALNLTFFRGYSPTLGRWLSRDPLGESAGANLYAYVENSPLNAIDSLGLWRRIVTSAELNGQPAPWNPNNGDWGQDFNPANFPRLEKWAADVARRAGIKSDCARDRAIRSNFRHALTAAYYEYKYGPLFGGEGVVMGRERAESMVLPMHRIFEGENVFRRELADSIKDLYYKEVGIGIGEQGRLSGSTWSQVQESVIQRALHADAAGHF